MASDTAVRKGTRNAKFEAPEDRPGACQRLGRWRRCHRSSRMRARRPVPARQWRVTPLAGECAPAGALVHEPCVSPDRRSQRHDPWHSLQAAPPAALWRAGGGGSSTWRQAAAASSAAAPLLQGRTSQQRQRSGSQPGSGSSSYSSGPPTAGALPSQASPAAAAAKQAGAGGVEDKGEHMQEMEILRETAR